MTFFFDNGLSPKYAIILRALDVEVVHLKEMFAEDTLDVDWIPQVGELGYLVLSEDTHILTRPAERKCLRDNKVTALFVGRSFVKRRKWDQALWLVKHWPQIEQQAERLTEGTCVRISDRGKLEILP